MNKKDLILYLNSIYINNTLILKIVEEIGEIDFFAMDRSHFPFLNDDTYNKIISRKNLEDFKYYGHKVDKMGVDYVTILDDNYPINLEYIEDKPSILYYKGKLDKRRDKNSIAFVGSRKCTNYGKWACESLTRDIVKSGITTVSGLAYGIDGICHDTTLKNKGKSIGVIGCGIDQIYPKSNKYLYQKMEEEGLILSEFPLGTAPVAFNFPRRNRIISGISLATVVVEAKEKSGTMITTRFALEQGKEVFAVCGNINSIYSKGCNKLIQEGAKLVMNAQDILEEMEYLLESKQTIKTKDYSKLEKDELLLVKYINENPSINSDKIAEGLKINIEVINYLLTKLELNDYIENIGNNEFVIKE